jgi:hypothetical protein
MTSRDVASDDWSGGGPDARDAAAAPLLPTTVEQMVKSPDGVAMLAVRRRQLIARRDWEGAAAIERELVRVLPWWRRRLLRLAGVMDWTATR